MIEMAIVIHIVNILLLKIYYIEIYIIKANFNVYSLKIIK